MVVCTANKGFTFLCIHIDALSLQLLNGFQSLVAGSDSLITAFPDILRRILRSIGFYGFPGKNLIVHLIQRITMLYVPGFIRCVVIYHLIRRELAKRTEVSRGICADEQQLYFFLRINRSTHIRVFVQEMTSRHHHGCERQRCDIFILFLFHICFLLIVRILI